VLRKKLVAKEKLNLLAQILQITNNCKEYKKRLLLKNGSLFCFGEFMSS